MRSPLCDAVARCHLRRLRRAVAVAPLPAAVGATLVVLAPLALARVGRAVGAELAGAAGSAGVAEALVLGPMLAAAAAGTALAVSYPGRSALGQQLAAGPGGETVAVLACLLVPALVGAVAVLPSLVALCVALAVELPGGVALGGGAGRRGRSPPCRRERSSPRAGSPRRADAVGGRSRSEPEPLPGPGSAGRGCGSAGSVRGRRAGAPRLGIVLVCAARGRRRDGGARGRVGSARRLSSCAAVPRGRTVEVTRPGGSAVGAGRAGGSDVPAPRRAMCDGGSDRVRCRRDRDRDCRPSDGADPVPAGHDDGAARRDPVPTRRVRRAARRPLALGRRAGRPSRHSSEPPRSWASPGRFSRSRS